MLFATPISATSAKASTAGRSAGQQHDRDAPEHERERERLGEPPARDAHGEEGADEAARADGRVQQADPARARVEDVERDDDDQHVQRAADERLGDHQDDHDARPGLGREDAEARRARAGLASPSGCVSRRPSTVTEATSIVATA